MIAGWMAALTGIYGQPTIKGLLHAERQFASFTSQHTVRDGFLTYMDSAGIIFRQGRELNALKTYQVQKAGEGILNWEPAFAVINAAGNMGATTGPYEFRPKKGADTPVTRGSFTSIWHFTGKGEWKNLADLGVNYTSDNGNTVNKAREVVLGATSARASFGDIILLDKKLNVAIRQRDRTFLLNHIAADSWLNLEGQLPITGHQSVTAALQDIPAGVMFESMSGQMSEGSDFAYIFGATLTDNKKDNYLRVWVLHKGKWRVMLQAIKWK